MIQVIDTKHAPKAIGPYSQALVHNGLVYVSGQIPFNPETGELIRGSIAKQTNQVLSNIAAILKEAGTELNNVLKTTVYMTDLRYFDEMNKAYAEHFSGNKPARATVQVSNLPKGVAIEIDVISAI